MGGDDELYYAFVDEVNRKELLMKDIVAKLGISLNLKHKFYKRAKNEGLIPEGRYTTKKVKNYYYHKPHDAYVVRKVVRNEDTYFGEYPTEDMAKRAVELLEENNWDKTKLLGIRRRVWSEYQIQN